MKILKIKVNSNISGTMIYPKGFLSFPCIEHIYCDELETGICWLIALIQNEDFEKIIDKTDVVEMTVTETETFLDKYEPLTTEITDEAMIRVIDIKTRAGVELSDRELKAIDPEDPTPGIQYKKRVIDKIKARIGK